MEHKSGNDFPAGSLWRYYIRSFSSFVCLELVVYQDCSKRIHLRPLSFGQDCWRKLVPCSSSDQVSVLYMEDIKRIYPLE